MKKTIIAVYGTANVGKSMTISSLGRQIVASGGTTSANLTTKEYRAIIDYSGHTVGVQTYGDLAVFVNEGLHHFLFNSCDVIVMATKRYGDTVDSLGAFAGEHGYRIIWVAPYEVRDGSIPTSIIKDYGASHLLLMIDDIISNNL